MGVSGAKGSACGATSVVTCHILAQEAALGGNSAFAKRHLRTPFPLRAPWCWVICYCLQALCSKSCEQIKVYQERIGRGNGKIRAGGNYIIYIYLYIYIYII